MIFSVFICIFDLSALIPYLFQLSLFFICSSSSSSNDLLVFKELVYDDFFDCEDCGELDEELEKGDVED